jgi:hypothetical protein
MKNMAIFFYKRNEKNYSATKKLNKGKRYLKKSISVISKQGLSE